METETFIKVSGLNGKEPVRRYIGPFKNYSVWISWAMPFIRMKLRLRFGRFFSCMVIKRPSGGENPYSLIWPGALVLWNDPAICDYDVVDRIDQDTRVFRVVNIYGGKNTASEDDDMLLLTDGFSEVEAFAHEVDIISY